MNIFQRIIFIGVMLLTILVLCGASAFAGYTYGHEQGYVAGEEKGAKIGYDRGYREGQDTGFRDGYTKGQQKGHQLGYDAGFKAAVGGGYIARNPTYQEMKEFLAQDKTDAKRYVKGQYVCADFAVEVNNNAEAKGIRCAVVDLKFPGELTHVIVAFETVDKGLIFIEPQFDAEVTVGVGLSYSQANKFDKPSYDDTITLIRIMW